RCLIPLQPTRAGLHAMLGVEPPLGHAIMPSIARREHVAESSQAPLRSAASPTGRRRAARVATPARPGRTLDSSIAGRASPQAAGAASAPFGPGAPPALTPAAAAPPARAAPPAPTALRAPRAAPDPADARADRRLAAAAAPALPHPTRAPGAPARRRRTAASP